MPDFRNDTLAIIQQVRKIGICTRCSLRGECPTVEGIAAQVEKADDLKIIQEALSQVSCESIFGEVKGSIKAQMNLAIAV